MEKVLNRLVNRAKKTKNKRALDYLLKRGVSEKQIIDYEIGYIDFLIRCNVKNEETKRFWEWSKGGKFLRNKLLFPIRDGLGKLLGMEVRRLREKPRKFFLDRADYNYAFFGLDRAIDSICESREVFIVEGAFDLFPLQRVFENTIAALTANLGHLQISFLKRFVNRVFLVFDNDEIGNKFFEVVKFKCKDAVEVLKISYLAKDPAELWEKIGEEEFQKFFKKAREKFIF